MDVDDDFGDVYADIGLEIDQNSRTELSAGEGHSDDHDELFLYNQLYGVSTEKQVKSDSSLNDSAAFNSGMSEGFGRRGLPSDSKSFSLHRDLLLTEATRQMNLPPGLSSGVTKEEDKGHELLEECDRGLNKVPVEECTQGDVEDSDSDSEDDNHFGLNDEPATDTKKIPPDRDEDEMNQDDGKEDLMTITGGEDGLSIEEQVREEEPIPLDPFMGASDAIFSSGYHTYHMQYKYGRLEAGASSETAPPSSQGPPCAGLSSGRDTAGGLLGRSRRPGKGAPEREYNGLGSSQNSAVIASWGAPRKNPSEAEFKLPRRMTVVDLDLDSLQEKPWRRPGVDITDYFNFGFTEKTWKQYCRQLAQLRLQSTRQGKILLYQSAQFEQEYEPDFPPELAAAIGMRDASGNEQRQDLWPRAGLGCALGRGGTIQVEVGGGERLPSPGFHRYCFEDSHEVIQIVLHHASEDQHPVSVPVNSDTEESQEEDDNQGGAIPYTGRQFYRPWELEGPPYMWKRENMPTGLGPKPNMMGSHGAKLMPGHQMDVYCPSFFSNVPGMAMLQPRSNPNFEMFLGVPFQPPSARGTGVVRSLPYYSARPPEEFPPMTIPYEYYEPSHPRPPPFFKSLGRTPSSWLPTDWDDELSSGSCSNWNSKERRNSQERKDRDKRNDGRHTDEMERWECNLPVRPGPREINDQFSHRALSMDEVSAEERSEERNKFVSREFDLEDNEWDGGHSNRMEKMQWLQSQAYNRVRLGKE